MHKISLLPGDGIGPEVTGATVRVIEAAGVEIEWDRLEAGEEVMTKHGTPLPDEALMSIARNRLALKGPITTPIGTGFASVNVLLRKKLNLYANIRPARTLKGVKSRYEGVDIVVVRENSEDLYSGLEHIVVPGVVESLKIITETACMRIGRYAFQYAREMGRKKITAVHKANIMKLADGLFLECLRRCAREAPEIEYEEMIVDNTCQQLVLRPERFDVMVMENLYGDIVSDLCAGLVGGLGLAASANIGEGGIAVFEAVHGSAPDIAGKNLANPVALIFSSVLMLRHIGERDAAARIEKAVLDVLEEGKHVTGDLGGKATTSEITDAIVEKLQAT